MFFYSSMDKRGFIKTLEAVLAVLILFIFIYSMSQREDSEDSNTKVMKNIQEGLLKGISQNDNFRNCIVTANTATLPFIGTGSGGDPCLEENLKSYITGTLPSRFTKSGSERYKIWVCEVDSCTLPTLGGKYVYTSAVVISSDLKEQEYNPKIFRIWMW